jgi:2-keto-4-pentenoate hydratase/2-oxohepta-3-ene-1,7-dioic acid hydratase in catechol pathway
VRIARVLHESSALPILALERDGAVYDAAELDRVFDTAFSPDRLPGASDFHTRLFALGGMGLEALDARLRSGDRPTEARLLPGSFVWLPPCDTDRALYVQMAPYDAPFNAWGLRPDEPGYAPKPPLAEPLHVIGNARGLVGHEGNARFPEDETAPDFELSIAAILGEDLRGATEEEAESAILGYTILNAWTGRDEEAKRPPGSRRVPAQLGPVLVTASEVGDPTRLKAQAKVAGNVIATTTAGGATFSIAASIAQVSAWIDLRAGDVIGAGRMTAGSGAACGTRPAFGEVVELAVERLGKLSGRALR